MAFFSPLPAAVQLSVTFPAPAVTSLCRKYQYAQGMERGRRLDEECAIDSAPGPGEGIACGRFWRDITEHREAKWW